MTDTFDFFVQVYPNCYTFYNQTIMTLLISNSCLTFSAMYTTPLSRNEDSFTGHLKKVVFDIFV